ncbi:MAG: outer membrane beta-barrel protein [Fibrobacter sp.]|uniref:outer membrane beta-barrel protein n=1 Tax=Fibrobacter sp. TaxID=35828 RepID=UPI0025BB9070|nr:outer membrane beta-barrel protein [Fibrobacter sp.]MBR4784570.1 outer membrane beta-barrel protein [Fibrobacter sp.]
MNLRIVPFMAAALLAATTPSLADEFDDFDNDETTSSTDNGSAVEYDGSAASEFADDEEYAAEYAQYKKEKTSKAEINKQRTEGFARTILLGVHASAGTNTFIGHETEGWGLGYQGSAGLLMQLPLGVKNLNIVPEVIFTYRHYRYAAETDFGNDDASIDIMMFEIPLIVRYTFVDNNIFLGLGLNLGLKLSGSSEFNQDVGEKITRSNTIPTTSFEMGAALDLGYMVTRWVQMNIRIVQGFTNLLDKILISGGENAFRESNFLTTYATVGFTILF